VGVAAANHARVNVDHVATSACQEACQEPRHNGLSARYEARRNVAVCCEHMHAFNLTWQTDASTTTYVGVSDVITHRRVNFIVKVMGEAHIMASGESIKGSEVWTSSRHFEAICTFLGQLSWLKLLPVSILTAQSDN